MNQSVMSDGTDGVLFFPKTMLPGKQKSISFTRQLSVFWIVQMHFLALLRYAGTKPIVAGFNFTLKKLVASCCLPGRS